MKGEFSAGKWTPESFDSAMLYYEKAIEIDPDFVLAFTGICRVWKGRMYWGLITPVEGNPKAMDALMRAYVLDSNNSAVQYLLARRKTFEMYDWEGGEAGFKKTISLNPNHAGARVYYSSLLSILGRTEEALEQVDIAIKLEPLNPNRLIAKGMLLSRARKYDEAIKAFNDGLNLAPENETALWHSWATFYFAGRTEEAYTTLKLCWSKEEIRYDLELVKYLEQGYLKDGFKGACISLADRLVEIWTDNQHQVSNPVEMATLYSLGQETDKSIDWLEQLYQSRDPNLPYMLPSPSFDNVRPDPRFKDLCHRMDLPHAAVVDY
jgi:tetratricopeptide (TPR) repeat protein